MHPRHRIVNRITVAVFAISLVAPLVAMGHWPEGSVLRGAPVSHLPMHLDDKFPRKFEAFFDTHLGFRRYLVETNNWLEYSITHTSSTAGVAVGRDGWLFLDQDRMRESITASDPFTNDELEDWVQAMQGCAQHVGAWGGKCLLVLCPSKAAIYHDKLPASLPLAPGPRRYDRLLQRMRERKVPVLDLRAPLIEESRRHEVFGKLDTHWNGHGALVAAQHIAKAVETLTGKHVAFTPEAAKFESVQHRGDLAVMLHLPPWITQSVPFAMGDAPEAKWASERYRSVDILPEEKRVIWHRGDPRAPSVVVHRDSFSRALIPLLMKSFSRSAWLWRREFYVPLIDDERPDLVIVQVTERYLEGRAQRNPF